MVMWFDSRDGTKRLSMRSHTVFTCTHVRQMFAKKKAAKKKAVDVSPSGSDFLTQTYQPCQSPYHSLQVQKFHGRSD